jgi:hypothetical protein
MEDLVRRDLNHPSVVMWSIGNEGELQVCFFFVCAPCVCVCVCVCFCVSVCVSISARFRLCVCHPSVSPFGVTLRCRYLGAGSSRSYRTFDERRGAEDRSEKANYSEHEQAFIGSIDRRA